MLAQRIIVVSSDAAFARRAVPALKTVVESVGVVAPGGEPADLDADELQPSLCVLDLGGELAGASAERIVALAGDCPVIAVMPRAGLAAVVGLMQVMDAVVGAIVDEELDAGALAAMALKVMAPDGFGLAHVLPGAQIHEQSAGDFREKVACLAAIADFIEQVDVPRQHRAPIEQCVDEMLMNALYDAPVDAQGAHIFAGVPTKTRIRERTAQRVAVQYASDGRRFAVAVRDAFGSLARATVLRHLHKGLYAAQVERKAGGAGLGLYLMVNAATAVYFHVLPGIATEVVCVFDLAAPQLALGQVGFAVQREAAGRVASGPARRIAAGPRHRIWIAGALVAAAAVGAVVAWPRVFGGAREPAAPAPAPVARVELDSRPTGAAVEIDGAPAGSTPLALTTLAPGRTVSVRFQLVGYRAAAVQLQVPPAGDVKRFIQRLELSSDFVRVRFVSNPPGAEIVQSGRPATADRTYTPAEIFVEAGVVQRFTLTMPKHEPLVIEPFTPARGAGPLEKGGALKPLR